MRGIRTPLLHRLGEALSGLGRHPSQRPLVRVAIQVGLAGLVLGFLVFTVVDNWHELGERGVRLSVLWLALALVVVLMFQAATGFAWDLQLRMLGQFPDHLGTQMAWGKSMLARYVPGSILFVISRVVLTERQGVPRRVTLSAMFYETGLWFASAAAFAAWFLLTHPDQSDAWLGWAALAAVPLSLALLHPRLFGPLVNRMLRGFGRPEVQALLSPRQLLALLAYYAATWALMGVGMFLVARSIFPAAVSDWGIIASAQALAYAVSVVTLVFPGGLGIRDGAFAWAMTAAVPDGTFAIGAAVALAGRIVLSAVDVIYAGVVTAAARRWGRGLPDKSASRLARSESPANRSRPSPSTPPP